MLWARAVILATLARVGAGSPAEEVNKELISRKYLHTVPCENISIFSVRTVLKDLLMAKTSPRVSAYPMYATEADMKKQWMALPGVQPGDNPESRLVKYAHCHEAAMWFTQHLSGQEQEAFAAKGGFLPLLPAQELPAAGNDMLTRFYASKVACAECRARDGGTGAAAELGRQAEAREGVRTVPCEDLSIFSLRTVLRDLLGRMPRGSGDGTGYPAYASVADMEEQWRALPGVQPGNNRESLLVKHAHCHEAAAWFAERLTPREQQAFAKQMFLPGLPTRQLPAEGPAALVEFYASRVTCERCRGGLHGAGQVVV